MSYAAENLEEMHRIIREAALPAVPGEMAKAAILRASRALGLSFSRTRQHWYRVARSVPAHEADHLRAMRLRLKRQRRARLNHELQLLEAELSALEGERAPMDRQLDASLESMDRQGRLGARESVARSARPLALNGDRAA